MGHSQLLTTAEFFLIELNRAITGNNEVDWIDDDDWYFNYQNPESIFKRILNDKKALKYWEQYMDVTEEEEKALLAQVSKFAPHLD